MGIMQHLMLGTLHYAVVAVDLLAIVLLVHAVASMWPRLGAYPVIAATSALGGRVIDMVSSQLARAFGRAPRRGVCVGITVATLMLIHFVLGALV